jgi:hypothetical protein
MAQENVSRKLAELFKDNELGDDAERDAVLKILQALPTTTPTLPNDAVVYFLNKAGCNTEDPNLYVDFSVLLFTTCSV